MNIRPFQPGDEHAQVEIYNAASAPLPRFKPTTLQEVQRRTRARDFEPASRLFAEVGGKTVGYVSSQANGRVSFPWTLAGHHDCAEPLLNALLANMKDKGIKKVFAAYRADWPIVHQFFLSHGFRKTRDMVNYLIDLVDMPTPSARQTSAISPVVPEDVPAILRLMPGVLRTDQEEELQRHLFKNPYFAPTALFALRSRQDQSPVAVGILVHDAAFADPHAVDSGMPCFRLGAFGTEGMTAKRINGLFSFLCRPDTNAFSLGMDLMGHAVFQLRDYEEVTALAAQCASDTGPLLAFYDRNFRKQGSFPVFEREL